jgi:hypothetical protein
MRSEFVSIQEVHISLSRSPLRLNFILVFTPFRRVRCHIVLFDARTGEVRKGERPNCAFACSEVQNLTPGPPSPMIYRTRKWICHSLASVALGARVNRLPFAHNRRFFLEAEEPYCSRAGALAIRVPLKIWVVLRGGSKNTKQCGLGP